MKKACPHCSKQVSERASRCRHCGYRFPEGGGPRPAGLAMGAGFPLFATGTLMLFVPGLPSVLTVLGVVMVVVGLALFFDPR